MKLVLVALFLSSGLLADTITINMDEFAKMAAQPKITAKPKDIVVDVTPLTKEQKQPTSSVRRQKVYDGENLKEDKRDELIKDLRSSLESSKEFKYYFPNFDYVAFKRDIEGMLRDIVSQ